MAAELGKHDKALEYAQFASRIDLDDYNRNTREGLHTPALAGAWLNLVYGFGGLRSDGEVLSFNPSIPKGWNMFSFNIMYRGTRIHVKINRDFVSYKTNGGSVPVIVFENEYILNEEGVEVAMPADRLG
jgi:maltose phosphorylase